MHLAVVAGIVLYGAALLTVIAVTVLPRRRQRIERAADRLSAQVGLAIPAASRSGVHARLEWQRRAAGVGGVLGCAMVLGAVLLTLRFSWDTSASQLAIGAVFAGGAIGNAIAAVGYRAPTTAGPRIARDRAVRLADYVPPAERILGWAAAVVGLGACVAAAAIGGWQAIQVAACGCVILSLLLLEIGGRHVVRRAQPAGDVVALAWDDAFRGINLRGLVAAPLMTGIYGAVAAGTAVLSSSAVTAIMVGGAVASVWATLPTRRRSRYFLRRLWPQTAEQAARLAAGVA